MSQYDDDFDRWCQYGDEFENTVKCKHCGKRIDLIHSGVRWRLYEVGSVKLHVCRNNADAEEFPSC